AALGVARDAGWDRRIVQTAVLGLADALERPDVRATVAEVIDELLMRYRAGMGVYPRLWIGLAELLGVLDRERIVAALHSGLREVAKNPDRPLRARASEIVAELETRLTTDTALAARVEAAKNELLATPAVVALLDDLAASLRRTLLADLAAPRSEAAAWIAERLERARQALVTDAALRVQIGDWLKARVSELVLRHHGRIAEFIANGVRALGPEGVVRLIEEHAGDDLQFIRVNGTVVGGLAGGAVYDPAKKVESLDTIVGDLAEKWSWQDNYRNLVFFLRKGVKWHDGQPFTSKDVKFTFDMVREGADAPAKLRINPRKDWYSNIESIETPDAQTVVFHLKRPQPSILMMLASGYSPVYAAHVPPASYRTSCLGTGP